MILFLLGLVIGSFIAAFTYRFPRRIQFLRGRSFCPHCKREISWFDNIPLLSFLILGGKCRNCHKKISIRYPLIELATGIGFFVIGLNLFWLVILSILITIFVIDFEHQIIPDELVFTGLAILAIQSFLFTNLYAGFLCASILLLIHLLTRGRGMGLGDVKFAVLGGMIVGLKLSMIWLFLAFLTGGLTAIILVLGGDKKLKDKIAFGPFLVVAIPLSLWLNSSLSSLLLLF
jgi:leader peptidase (prepilin peptidase)/N-methyltransferase